MTIDEVKTEIRKIEKYYDFNYQTNDYDVLVNLTEISNLILSMIETHGRFPTLTKEKEIQELEKQIPKKVVLDKNIYLCPECGASAETDCGDDMLDYRLNYCDNCGQKLDWSEL